MKRKLFEEEKEDDRKFNSMLPKVHQHPPPLHLATTASVVEYLPVQEQEEDSKILHGGHPHPPTHDGATIEVVRRPRGRPPGSRNKPKPPSIISEATSEPSMSPYILEFPANVDVIAATTHFCRKRKLGLCVLTGRGPVSNITIRQPSATTGSAGVTFPGRFDILSISATILDQSTGVSFPGNGQFTVYVAAGPQGQVVGGVVVGPMVSAATIYLVAGTFIGHTFCRLQPDDDDDDDDDDTSRNGGGEYRPDVSGGAVEHFSIGSLYNHS
ncbi:hypothetical protein F511_19242 [Dorcoceras hygrometricum]|uniref:PPC domain-containing protein n=1 Tax=Dorcoceras hygrometricum TaxID=472368 RepID=A0A2Z7C928_9LAMI|nr:hypothetical protein F511_19242 [Dorcoceras hygrometricum]